MFVRAFLVTCLLSGLRAADSPATWLKALRNLVEDCPRTGVVECARLKALGAVDAFLSSDVVPLLDGLVLVKLSNASVSERSIDDGYEHDFDRVYRVPEKNRTLCEMLTGRLKRLLETHAIKINVERLRSTILDFSTQLNGTSANAELESRGRKRRRRHSVMPIIMMGLLLMGTVLIPMSFQFLAILGGKALILSKMALMLSSIQGLKKIATNGMNYGLYHAPVPEPWHERSTGASFEAVPYGTGYYGHFAGRSAVTSG